MDPCYELIFTMIHHSISRWVRKNMPGSGYRVRADWLRDLGLEPVNNHIRSFHDMLTDFKVKLGSTGPMV